MQKIAGMTILLRLEGLALALLAVWLYHAFHQPWWIFAVLFLAPDLFSMLGYLGGARIGAAIYNAAHSWVTITTLFFLVWYRFDESTFALSLPFILTTHIGIDRPLGYGLKHAIQASRTPRLRQDRQGHVSCRQPRSASTTARKAAKR